MTQGQQPQFQPKYRDLPQDSIDRIFTEKELSEFSILSLLKLGRLKGAKGLKLTDTRGALTRKVLLAQVPKPVGKSRSGIEETTPSTPTTPTTPTATASTPPAPIITITPTSSAPSPVRDETKLTKSFVARKHVCPTCQGRGFVLADQTSAVVAKPISNIPVTNGRLVHPPASNRLARSEGNRCIPVESATSSPSAKKRGRAPDRKGLSLPQIRVICTLANAEGPLTKAKIADLSGNKTPVLVGRAIGYSDPAKRAAFENTKDGGFRPSLLTLGLVTEITLDIDGVDETTYELTESGNTAYKKLQAEGRTNIPTVRG